MILRTRPVAGSTLDLGRDVSKPMKIAKAFMMCLCIIILMADFSQAKEWRGIVPLHSTREDVKRLLGPSPEPGERFYEFENEVASIQYSSGLCEENIFGGWNVPRDTVIRINVSPKSRLLFSALNLDLSRYKKSVDPKFAGIVYYNDEEEGFAYQVGHDEVDGIFYEPAAKDKHLGCPEAAPIAPTLHEATTYPVDKIDEFGGIPLKEEKERLNHLAYLLKELPNTQGYIIVYAGRRALANEARLRAERAKHYMVNELKIETSRILAVDGGYREGPTVELWLGESGAPPPTVIPTVPPREVQIIKKNNARDRNR